MMLAKKRSYLMVNKLYIYFLMHRRAVISGYITPLHNHEKIYAERNQIMNNNTEILSFR